MGNEIFQLKPNFHGVGIDLKAAWQRFRGKNHPDPLEVVAQRFLQVFLEHGVAVAQIPRLIPSLGFDSLKSPDTLLAALRPEILESTAQLFGVRLEWLEGVDERLYEFNSCYKQPSVLLDDLAKNQATSEIASVKIITSTENLEATSVTEQALVLVRTEEIFALGEERIERFHVYGDQWDWRYSPCRIQLKAMARLIFQRYQMPVPIYRVRHDDLMAIRDGRQVPRDFISGCILTDPSMEDFGLSTEESAVAKEIEELPEVLAYIEREGLVYWVVGEQ